MGIRRCLACGRPFQLDPHLPEQSYCTAPPCQRERRKRWQRERRAGDHDYRVNQAAASRRWAQEHPDYWRAYRQAHPDYAARNREQQRQRREKQPAPAVAKMDASTPPIPLTTGIYLLSRIDDGGVAKMDAWIAEITVLSSI